MQEVIIKVPMDAAENEEFAATATIKDAAGNESSSSKQTVQLWNFLVLENDSADAVCQKVRLIQIQSVN